MLPRAPCRGHAGSACCTLSAASKVIAEALLAESVGFDSCFFGEHHQDKDGFLAWVSATSPPTSTRSPSRWTSVVGELFKGGA